MSRYLGLDHHGRVVAVHRTDAGVPVFTGDPADLAPEERAWLEGAAAWGATEGAYAAMHRSSRGSFRRLIAVGPDAQTSDDPNAWRRGLGASQHRAQGHAGAS